MVEARDKSRCPRSTGTCEPATLQAIGAFLLMTPEHPLSRAETSPTVERLLEMGTWWARGGDWRSGVGQAMHVVSLSE